MCIYPYEMGNETCTSTSDPYAEALNRRSEEMKMREDDLRLVPLKRKKCRLSRIQKQAKYGRRR